MRQQTINQRRIVLLTTTRCWCRGAHQHRRILGDAAPG
jgi:hypothetical protein